jgi:hypothetical protein
MSSIEKHIIVLDKLYRCFILRCLNKAAPKEKRVGREHRHHRCCFELSNPLLSGRDLIKLGMSQRELVEELRVQWKRLWLERAEDKVRAEGIAAADYCDLFLEKGTVIHATRNFKGPKFKEILERHQIANLDRYMPPNPGEGGWNKFIKTNIAGRGSRGDRRADYHIGERKREKQQLKKAGRGWLHK